MHVYIYIGTADADAFINDSSIFRVESEDIEEFWGVGNTGGPRVPFNTIKKILRLSH